MTKPRLVIGLLLFALLTTGQDSCDTSTPDKITGNTGTTELEDTEEAPAKPSADVDPKCDYLLGDFASGTEKGYKFVGSAKITNTGGGDIKVRVTGRWEQLGSDPIREQKTVTVREGKSRTVRLKVLATQDQISAHQSADGECKVTGKIVG